MRGVSMRPESREAERDRERPYTAESYAAQYGVTIDAAREIRDRSTTHRQIVRQITALLTNDAELKREALFIQDKAVLSDKEERLYSRTLKTGIPTKDMNA